MFPIKSLLVAAVAITQAQVSQSQQITSIDQCLTILIAPEPKR